MVGCTCRLHLSAASLGELYTWAFRVRASTTRMQRLLDMLPLVSLLALDAQVARRFGELDAYLLDHGLTVSEIDLQNAATALVHDLTLVTHNVRDFANIPGLRVVDWLNP